MDNDILQHTKDCLKRQAMKSDKCMKIKNYLPISNLCSLSKIFEKLIIKRIEEIQKSQDVDLTGSAQHGFKKSRSTATAGLTIQ